MVHAPDELVKGASAAVPRRRRMCCRLDATAGANKLRLWTTPRIGVCLLARSVALLRAMTVMSALDLIVSERFKPRVRDGSLITGPQRYSGACGAPGSVGGAVAVASAPAEATPLLFGSKPHPAGDLAAQIRANGGRVEIGQDDLVAPAADCSLADDVCAGKAKSAPRETAFERRRAGHHGERPHCRRARTAR